MKDQTDFIQTEEEREKRMKEKETQREMVHKNIFKIMAENILNTMESNYLESQAQQSPINILYLQRAP